MTASGRDIEGLAQSVGAVSTTLGTIRDDVITARTLAGAASREALATRREVEVINRRLNHYVGRVDGIQLRTNESWDRLGAIETHVRELRTELTSQSELMRQILDRLPPPAAGDTSAQFFPPPSPY
jgi:chromosome segregation ATPase